MRFNELQRQRFADAFVQAVILFLQSGNSQAINWNDIDESFDVSELESGTAPSNVDFCIGSTWTQWLGEKPAPETPLINNNGAPEDWKRYTQQLKASVMASARLDWILELITQVIARSKESAPQSRQRH